MDFDADAEVKDLVVKDLTVEFTKGDYTVRPLDNLSFTVQAGSLALLLGPSGCGKTTLLSCLGGILKPTAGTIVHGDNEVTTLTGQALTQYRQRGVGVVFQAFNLVPSLTALENVTVPMRSAGISSHDARQRAVALLHDVGLGDRMSHRPNKLSGGQQQRVAIARALAVEPKVMLLDEPLSALDLKLRQHMRAELRAIQKRTGVTFIYITHDQGEALAMSDRVGVMSQGVLQQVGTPNEIYNTPRNGFVASFVGENNIFTGSVTGSEGGFAKFETAFGTFLTKLGPGVDRNSVVKLYVRPEHSTLQASAPQGKNSLPVEVSEVAFEGNFINIHSRDEQGKIHQVQVQNDPSNPPPQPGARLYLVFPPEHAVLLSDMAQVQGHA